MPKESNRTESDESRASPGSPDVACETAREGGSPEGGAPFRALVEHCMIGISLTGVDGKVLYINPAGEKMLGYAPGEFDRQNFAALVHPDDFPTLNEEMKRHSQRHGETRTSVARFRHRDGSWRWIQGYGVNLLHDREIRAIVGYFEDVTQQHEEEQQRRNLVESERSAREQSERAQQSLQFLADAGAILTSSLDLEVVLDNLNRLATAGLADWCLVDLVEEDGRVTRLSAIHRDPDLQPCMDVLRRFPPVDGSPSLAALKTGQTVAGKQLRSDSPAVSTLSEEHRAAVLKVAVADYCTLPLFMKGQVIGAMTLGRSSADNPFDDNDRILAGGLADRAAAAIENALLYRQAVEAENQRRQRADELSEMDRRKDEFLAILGHELRNPLGAISNAVLALKKCGASDTTAQRSLGILERQVQRQKRLVDDLLDVSRLTRGKLALQFQILDLRDAVRQVVEELRGTADVAGLSLDLQLDHYPIPVRADSARMAQILENLVQNAIKFTPSGGEITVRANADIASERACVTVADTGIGIRPDVLSRLFDPFSQGEESLDRAHGGLGLGLSVVKGLVELHGGEVVAKSAGQATGASFTVWIPLSREVEAPSERAVEASASPDARGRRVLIVEDNPDVAQSLADLLELSGHTVAVASDGRRAIDLALDFGPQIVLCDIGLPGMDGYAVGSELRRLPNFAGTQLIALTGYGQEQDRIRSREAGFDLHLTKPIDPAQLENLLGKL